MCRSCGGRDQQGDSQKDELGINLWIQGNAKRVFALYFF
jgi:hypothetical protein